MDGKYDGVARF
uniref:Uncharacterized protein n=1 Tax=Oryza meridionalis TaxID=40149 RepID=A0A0E0D473_9ORYZ